MRALLLVLLVSPVLAASAMWTGRQEPVLTVTGQSAWRCEYMVNGQRFWRVFQGSCPAMIEVM
jgi:hypothetical protein